MAEQKEIIIMLDGKIIINRMVEPYCDITVKIQDGKAVRVIREVAEKPLN
ncbi:MAG: hypothetical protein ACTINS_05180 [Lactococcus lactis]|uniref:Uncharacterized protein n=2 Tax=Lactococcus lactis TaxID=1358 RepID=A0A6M0M9K9_9LACT|nr:MULTISPECIES: hypothetical protein [Lactococcus]MDT3326125.1 hypothetical protein [Bacillota bacterium]ARE10252.1 hypothetical protein LLUC063_0434 [Lactococcus lactis subsp. lactis]ARE12722.1 hypothetical protein LLUC11_0387 [Lactococcus lactis subsp. lactis]ARE15131.1 hypothetical protein LLUC08_0385 [Lactococcus lactis subsp. lactis]KSU32241.1 hypothetical protein UC317_1755 [Lactococcus lactis subsp. lactis]